MTCSFETTVWAAQLVVFSLSGLCFCFYSISNEDDGLGHSLQHRATVQLHTQPPPRRDQSLRSSGQPSLTNL